jgi:hypothetical protein
VPQKPRRDSERGDHVCGPGIERIELVANGAKVDVNRSAELGARRAHRRTVQRDRGGLAAGEKRVMVVGEAVDRTMDSSKGTLGSSAEMTRGSRRR